MLEYVRGQVVRVGADSAVLEIAGVGIRVLMPTGDLASLRGEASVHTILQIRDDDVLLYGFSSERARELFRALTSVSGVGPKLALAVLSFHAADALERAIVSGDADALTLVSGVGKKTAQRIVLELRDKVGLADETVVTGPLAEVREGLRGLGYTSQEIQDAMASLPADGDVPTLLRHALRALGAREPAGAAREPAGAAREPGGAAREPAGASR